MNKQELNTLNRIEQKVDSINERSIRTEEKLDNHVKEHEKRIKWGLTIVGFLVPMFVAGFKYLWNFIKSRW